MTDHMPDFPPLDYQDEDFYLPDDPYPDVYLDPLPDEPFWLSDDRASDLPPVQQDGLQSQDQSFVDDAWRWQDTRLIGVERDQLERYEIGALDLYANMHTGETTGLYLPIAQFEDEQRAVERFNQLDDDLSHQAPDQHIAFLEEQAFAHQPDPPNWRDATEPEYRAYDHINGQTIADDVGVDTPSPEQTALGEIGLRLSHADLDPPMFTDEGSNTHFWIGVFQPDSHDKAHCITSILSLTSDESGAYHAQLAPCAVGDWETAHDNAHFLIEKAQQGGMDYAFDAAEAMARGSQQHDIWQSERGVPMEIDR